MRWFRKRQPPSEGIRPEHAEQVALMDFTASGDQWSATFASKRGPESAIGALIASVGEYFIKYKGDNYLEQSFYHPKLGPMTLIFQRARGKTPHQLQKEAEAERDAARADAEALRQALNEALSILNGWSIDTQELGFCTLAEPYRPRITYARKVFLDPEPGVAFLRARAAIEEEEPHA